jgi:hypothetical protein
MRPLTRSSLLKQDGLSLQHVRSGLSDVSRISHLNEATPRSQFLLRTEILKAYRSAVRATRRTCVAFLTIRNGYQIAYLPRCTALHDSATRRETLDWLRRDLDKLKDETDFVSRHSFSYVF